MRRHAESLVIVTVLLALVGWAFVLEPERTDAEPVCPAQHGPVRSFPE